MKRSPKVHDRAVRSWSRPALHFQLTLLRQRRFCRLHNSRLSHMRDRSRFQKELKAAACLKWIQFAVNNQ